MDFKSNAKKDPSNKKKGKSGTWALIAIAVTLVLFGVLCFFQAKLAEGDTRYFKSVYLASKEIPEGTEITSENLMDYVVAKEMDTRVIPADYILAEGTAIEELIGQFADKKYLENDVITLDGFEKYNAREGMTNPVEVSFAVSGVDQVVAGTLREGDSINIYAIRPYDADDIIFYNERYAVELLYTGKIVTNAFTSGGEYVENTNEDGTVDETPVTMLTIFIEDGEEEAFFKTLTECSIRVSRVVE